MRRYLFTGVIAIGLAGDGFRQPETFDEAGSSWAVTRFSDVRPIGGSEFVRETLTPAMGAPDTTPPLPINAGGDKEGVYRETGLAGTHSYALLADAPANALRNVDIRGYVAIGNPDPFGAQSVGFVLRASASPSGVPANLDGYAAVINHNGGGMATFSLYRVRDDTVFITDVLAQGSFAVDLDQENYRIDFRARDNVLFGRVLRVSVVNGTVTEVPILLSVSGGPPTDLLVAYDETYASGRAGVLAFTRGDNSIFFEDVQLGLPPGQGVSVPGP